MRQVNTGSFARSIASSNVRRGSFSSGGSERNSPVGFIGLGIQYDGDLSKHAGQVGTALSGSSSDSEVVKDSEKEDEPGLMSACSWLFVAVGQ